MGFLLTPTTHNSTHNPQHTPTYTTNIAIRGVFIRILITAGPTQEPIDPVRFISNRSTGYMGYKIAEVATRRNHSVILISGPTKLTPLKVKKFISIQTADELFRAIKRELKDADCLIMCAAVGDFRVRKVCKKKIKRGRYLQLKLVPNKDILREFSRHKGDKLMVGFSLETENTLKNSCKKLKKKNLDIIVANRLNKYHNPFGNNKLDVFIIDKSGKKVALKNKKKEQLAHVLLDKIEQLWYLRR